MAGAATPPQQLGPLEEGGSLPAQGAWLVVNLSCHFVCMALK